jgi:hypothetical protein
VPINGSTLPEYIQLSGFETPATEHNVVYKKGLQSEDVNGDTVFDHSGIYKQITYYEWDLDASAFVGNGLGFVAGSSPRPSGSNVGPADGESVVWMVNNWGGSGSHCNNPLSNEGGWNLTSQGVYHDVRADAYTPTP